MDSAQTTRRETFLGFQPPAIGEEEIAAVAETLRSGWLTTGPAAAELERRFAEYLQVEHALAVTSGTAAMHLALAALGVGPGDEVVTTPITWPATANVVVHVGATPVFADVRAEDLNIDPQHAASLVGPHTFCYDLVYGSSDTPFVAWAKTHGAGRAVHGWGMLVEQAAESFAIWRGVRPDTKPLLKQIPR